MNFKVLAGAAFLLVAGCEGEKPAAVKNPSAAGKEATQPVNMAPVVDPTGALGGYKYARHEVGCAVNLQQIHLALQVWFNDRGGQLPGPFLYRELLSMPGSDHRIFVVPRGEMKREDVIARKKGVYATTSDTLTEGTAAGKPIVWDPEPRDDGRHVLKFGGSVVQVNEDEFKALMAEFEGK